MPQDFYDIDFNQQILDIMPPDKASKVENASLFKGLIGGMKWLSSLFSSYRKGTAAGLWISFPWPIYSQVYYKRQVFESLVGNNMELPSNKKFWMLIQSNHRGSEERILYTANKLELEYALNRYFGTVFRQPNGTSDIFLTVTQPFAKGFIVGGIQPGIVYSNRSEEYVINQLNPAISVTLKVNIPITIYNTIDEFIVRAFLDSLVTYGVYYQIQTY